MFGKDSLTLKGAYGGLFALLLASFAAPASAANPSFTVHDAKTELVGEVYRLDANLDLKLTPEALAALDSGVVLTVVLDIEVYSPSRYLWDDVLASLEQRYEIQYHALSDLYLLRELNSGSQFAYSSLDTLLENLGRIEQLPIIDAHLLQAEERYKVRVRSRLDLGSLPVPMQLKAYVSSKWWLSSGWYSWDL